uniref:Uncharacterized protein n=1 Tax=Parascaris equorum TaxID=6256 RepID=A0A914RCG5_PAREQ
MRSHQTTSLTIKVLANPSWSIRMSAKTLKSQFIAAWCLVRSEVISKRLFRSFIINLFAVVGRER